MESKPIELRETTIAGSIVRMQLADHADPAQAVQWLHFQVNAEKTGDEWYLVAIQRVALHHARDVIDAEIRRVEGVLNRVRG